MTPSIKKLINYNNTCSHKTMVQRERQKKIADYISNTFVRGITEILLFEQTGQQLMMVAFFCVDLKMLALQKHVSQRRN
ncbi:MAG: hypothetical protein WB988_06325 [Candidatus Nitrosopolaris sp.]